MKIKIVSFIYLLRSKIKIELPVPLFSFDVNQSNIKMTPLTTSAIPHHVDNQPSGESDYISPLPINTAPYHGVNNTTSSNRTDKGVCHPNHRIFDSERSSDARLGGLGGIGHRDPKSETHIL